MGKLEDWQEDERIRIELAKQVFGQKANNTSQLMSTSFRYKNTTVATIIRFMNVQNERPTNISQVLRYGLEGFEDLLLTQHPELGVSEEHEAVQVLAQAGIDTAGSKINKKRQYGNLAFESYTGNSRQPSGFQPCFQPSFQPTSGIDPAYLAEAERMLKEKSRPQVHLPDNCQEMINAQFNERSGQVPFDDGLPSNLPRSTVPKAEPASTTKLVLKADGTTKEVNKDRSKQGRKEVFIICRVCNKHSVVLLDFEPESNFLDSDSCPICEGITPHQIPEGDLSEEFEISPFKMPVKELRTRLMAGPSKDQMTLNEEEN